VPKTPTEYPHNMKYFYTFFDHCLLTPFIKNKKIYHIIYYNKILLSIYFQLSKKLLALKDKSLFKILINHIHE
jgi:hypothetical protein